MSQNLEKRFAFPWYRQGLRFSCTQCGKCCTGSPGFVWVTEDEIVQMAHFLKVTVPLFMRSYVRRIGQNHALVERKSQNHSCVFYQDQRCQVYAARPLQCRAYPFWQENLLSEESWEQAAKECEGIQADSPLVAYETITKFLEDQRQQGPDQHFVASSDS